MTDQTIYRYEVPVDDQWHDFDLSGEVVCVAARQGPEVVEFWARVYSSYAEKRRFRVFGTGHALPEDVSHIGTALVGPLVWHLMEDVSAPRSIGLPSGISVEETGRP